MHLPHTVGFQSAGFFHPPRTPLVHRETHTHEIGLRPFLRPSLPSFCVFTGNVLRRRGQDPKILLTFLLPIPVLIKSPFAPISLTLFGVLLCSSLLPTSLISGSNSLAYAQIPLCFLFPNSESLCLVWGEELKRVQVKKFNETQAERAGWETHVSTSCTINPH